MAAREIWVVGRVLLFGRLDEARVFWMVPIWL